MNIDQLKEFIKQVGWGYLATTDGKIVGVRPMAGLIWKDNQLLAATFTNSDKVAQLKKVPAAEYCFCDTTGKHVRIAGPCALSYDNDEKLSFYNAVPELKNYISDPASPDYVLIKMTPTNIRVMESDHMKYDQITLK